MGRRVATLACFGFASGLLTVGGERVFGALGSRLAVSLAQNLHVGLLFGMSVAAYFVARDGRSILKGIAFVAASCAAYMLAMSVASLVFVMTPGALRESSGLDIPLHVFLIAGAAGGALVTTSALLLFGRSLHWGWMRGIFGGAVAGGVLGSLGWALGPVLGGPLLSAAYALNLRPPLRTLQNDIDQQLPRYFSLFVVWHTGIAALIGLVTCPRDARALGVTPESPGMGAIRRKDKRVAIAGGLFLAALFIYLAVDISKTVRAERAAARRMDVYRMSRAEVPSLQNLPSMAPLGSDVLVVEDIGGLFAEKPFIQYQQQTSAVGPRVSTYSISYVPMKDAPFGTYQPMVRVFVEQYPNIDWARYKTKYPNTFNPALDEAKVLETVTKFGQRIVMNTVMRNKNGTGALYYLWPSGNLVVLISYEMNDVNEEFVRRIEKHPSSW